MNSHVEITLTSSDAALSSALQRINIVGATINYGINRLPIAHVHIDPVGLSPTFCNFDYYRRRDVRLVIRTGGLEYLAGCIAFDGMIDGISISQQPGGLKTSLVIKHKFTLLNEVYPRLLGLSPGSANIFALQVPATFDPTFGSSHNKFFPTDLPLYGAIAGGTINTNQALIPFIVEVFKAVIKSQLLMGVPTVDNKFIAISAALTEVIKAQQINDKFMTPIVQDLLNNINTEYTKKMTLKPGDKLLSADSPSLTSKIITDLTQLDDTVYNSLVRMVGEYGCVFVVANKKAFIIPETPYIKVKLNETKTNGKSKQTNIAYPADYTSFSFNDIGENTIKGVYIIPDAVGSQGTWIVGGTNVLNGKYIDETTDGNRQVFGNIVVKTLPQVATSYVSHIAAQGSLGVLNAVNASNEFIEGYVSLSSITNSLNLHKEWAVGDGDQIRKFLNAWAQLEYCKIKYEDRTGYISMPFNNNWVPGAPGAVYTQHPGTYVNFFVTEVSHNFDLTPTSGNASTNVSFKGGRPGNAAISAGLERIDLYDYAYEDSQNFANEFLTDVTP